VIEGILRIPLRRFEDERGWLMELRRESLLPKPTRQTNVSFSRRGVIRGLHYHERGQDDLFVCLEGTARVVVYADDGRVVDIVEKAGTVDLRYDVPPSDRAVVGLYCYPPDVFDAIERLEPSSRGELEITDVNRHYAREGRLVVREVEGWWEDAGKHWQHLAQIGRKIEQTGVNR